MFMKRDSKKILLIDDSHSVLKEKLLSNGFTVDYHPEYTKQDIIEHIPNYDGLIVRSKIQIDREIIDKATNLVFIARSGAGMDSIDTEYAENKDIKCLNSPEGNRDAVGEHTLGLLLSLFNKINIADNQVRQGIWLREENRGLEIKGKTIGIIGYGNMGQAFAKRLSGFDCNVIAYDKYKTNYSDDYAKEVSLQEIFRYTDVLSLHVPLTQETHYMVDIEFINQFSKPFYLLNASRGKVVKLKDLILALKNSKVLGAGLDVLEYESMSLGRLTSPSPQAEEELQALFKIPNTVLSPHVAGWTIESYYKLADVLADKIIDCFKE